MYAKKCSVFLINSAVSTLYTEKIDHLVIYIAFSFILSCKAYFFIHYHLFSVSVYEVSAKLALTINVPVVYMAWDVMILMWANPFRRLLEGLAPRIKTLLGPHGTRFARDFLGPPLPMAREMDLPSSKSLSPSAL
jgi:hypothetical protein